MITGLLTSCRAYLSKSPLRARAARGGAWLGAGTVAAQLFRLGRNVVLTRLLAPESFGVMAIIISIGSMMDMFTEIGVRESVIQNPNGDKYGYLNSALWLSAARSFVSYGAIFLLAPEAASFYHSPELTALGRVALAGVVFKGLMSPRAFVALKRMDYKQWTIVQYGSSIAATVITIVLAFMMRNVWALAIGFAAEYAVLFVSSYVLFPFRPRFSIDRHSGRELIQFSKGVFGLSFLNLIYVRADIFVLGRLIPQDRLGIYSMAVYLAQAPAAFLLNYQAQILLPVFSQVQTESERTNSLLRKGASLLFFFVAPALVFIALSGRALLSLLYGTAYAVGFWAFLVAAMVAAINVANAQLTTAFYAAGKPQLHRLCVAIMAVVMLVVIYPASRWGGMVGAQLCALLAMIVGYAVQLRQARSVTGFRLGISKGIGLRVGGALVVLAIAVLIRGAISFSTPALNLLLGAFAAGATLLAGILLSYHRDRWHIIAT